jgi:hypothetical protein
MTLSLLHKSYHTKVTFNVLTTILIYKDLPAGNGYRPFLKLHLLISNYCFCVSSFHHVYDVRWCISSALLHPSRELRSRDMNSDVTYAVHCHLYSNSGTLLWHTQRRFLRHPEMSHDQIALWSVSRLGSKSADNVMYLPSWATTSFSTQILFLEIVVT